MAASNEELFRAMTRMWAEGAGPMVDSVRKYFADDCVWENPGLPTTTGVEEAVQLAASLVEFGMVSVDVEFRNVASVGNVVFTERIDWLIRPDGTRFCAPVVGVTEYRDGKITAWREYADSAIMSEFAGDTPSTPG
jgi:limonene-1,2-epoxide hydrolase